jgi:hypothetical protein
VRFRSLVIIVALIAITGSSCKKRGGKYINQGEIHYAIEYFGDLGFSLKEYMPKTLVVSFKDDKILFEISSPIGNSGILNLSNPEKEIFDTYISFFTLKYAYSAAPGEVHPGFEAMQGMEVKETEKTAVICGYNCKNAEVTFPTDRSKVYNIWYTEEIDVKEANAATPFSSIDGVLMSFFFFMGPAEMHFTVENVYNKEIPDKTFERRDKFVRVTRDQINNLINKMISM